MRYNRLSQRLFWPLMALGPVLFLIALVARALGPLAAVISGAILWLVAGYVTYLYLRWRALAAGYTWILVVGALFWIGVVTAGGFAIGG